MRLEQVWTSRVEELFVAAGWSPTRAVDSGPAQALLREAGFVVEGAPVAFLDSCLGLSLAGPDQRTFTVDPAEALFWLGQDAASSVASFMAGPACPVGYGSCSALVVGADGRCVLLKDDWVGFAEVGGVAEAFDRYFYLQDYGRQDREGRWHWLASDQRPSEFRDSV